MTTDIDLAKTWNSLLSGLEKSLTRPIYEALISSTKPYSIGDGKFVVAVPNAMVKEWLSQYCIPLIEQELRFLPLNVNQVEFVVGPQDLFQTPLLEAPTPAKEGFVLPSRIYLNPRYSFDTFVVGHSNRFAHAAALAVAEAPATTYNPLFLYGGVGLGKTHLMQAIARQVTQSSPHTKILYTTCEIFTNELITAIQERKTPSFRNKYRNNDLLLIDDVQFIVGKEATQEEFFHTFNALYEAGKQLVISSDRPPKEIPTLEERLRSRFEWGLIADIQPPDFETRMAILKKKAELSELSVPNEILTFIASKIISNIRELEGALIRVVAFASLTNAEIDIPLVDHVLKDMLTPSKEKTNLTIDLIKKATAEVLQVRIDDMSAKIRTKEIATARQIAMYLARELTNISFPIIGEEFGGRDHSTVMYACEKIKNSLKNEPELEGAIQSITENLRKYMT